MKDAKPILKMGRLQLKEAHLSLVVCYQLVFAEDSLLGGEQYNLFMCILSFPLQNLCDIICISQGRKWRLENIQTFTVLREQ